jgi:Histidine kinase-, DNA gyrase B-, and HSP90-like ATPase
MSWVTVIWSMNAGACLTLAAFYGAVWSKQRANRAYLLFSCSAIAAAVISAFELRMLNATTVEQYQVLMRWIHVPAWVLTLSFVAFVRLYLHAGRRWLAWSIFVLRTLVLILNFIFGFSTKTNGHGMGLRIMRYRAQCIGGSCEVHTGPGKGTAVCCRVPLEAQPSLSTIS